MPTTYKVLGQVNPIAQTYTTLYTVSSNTQAVVSSISICNANTTAKNYTIAIRPGGEALNQKHFLTSNNVVSGLDTIVLTIGLTLSSSDVVTVWTDDDLISVGIYGSEIT